jgi:hypothetical protein
MMGGFHTLCGNKPLSDAPGSRARLFLTLTRFLPEGTGGGEGEGEGADTRSSVSNTVIGGGEGEWMTRGEGAGVGSGGSGGGRSVVPIKSLGDIPAAIISRSSSSPTKMCPGRAVSSGGFHCPSREASSAKMYQYSVKIRNCFGLHTVQIFKNPVRRKPNVLTLR